ncbi:hypothetical protein ACS8E9_17685 [Pseudomonas neustonica]|uniref:hypothetical protein n=1 Tax=Pseudomonas neustonica TaxID=2487346 RepID=UPI003F478B23
MEIELILKSQDSRLQLFIQCLQKQGKVKSLPGRWPIALRGGQIGSSTESSDDASMLIISPAEIRSVKLSLNNDFDYFHFDPGTCVSVEKDAP